MAENRFHRGRSRVIAAGLALFALALIVVAPFVSISLQKLPMPMMPGMMHHPMMEMDEHHSGHKPVLMPIDHAEACGYCVLLSHMPGIQPELITPLHTLFLLQGFQPSSPLLEIRHFFAWLYPHPRAPPA
ncbi:DUF2946 domain-containing protein [Cedecea sp. NFIX57]|uniref:DUF2946 domain-containing protein n=1 Tax=Cedecea sp. NFIX57 TaxID=1566286 RepID=UPI000A09B8B2|nr:DUF2946 domain-containing protein [Cedecea sp. NFIX57]SMG29071.1 Protein of unknown function [Cedecea sp. NFIX57]